MKFIAIKTDDGTKGKLAFYCRMLHVSCQGFYKYLSVKDRPWKYQTLADTMIEIHAEDVCNDTYGRARMFQALTLKRNPKELRKQTVRLVNRMIFLREISHQKTSIFMTKLSKYEKETIINWNEAENTASIYTLNADLKRRLAEFSRKYPLLCRLERSTTEGSMTYVMDKSRLSIRLVPPYSEERLAAAREYAKQHGFQVLRTEKESA